MSKLIHIADRVLNRPLMILPEKLALIAQVLEGRIGIDATDLKEIEADGHLQSGPDASRFVGNNAGADGRSRKPYRVEKGVAVIPVLGSLVNRGAWLGAYSGMTSYEGIGFQLDSAAQDPDVTSVLLDLDSPGGEAVGAFEAADKVRALAKSKEVVAIVNGMAASAAYAIASAASSIVTTPSGVSGSIGVVLMHADYSHAMHEKGIKPTLIHAGAHKVDGNPYQPLSESVKADLKAEVDHFYSLFVSSVATGRKGRMTDKSIRGTEARTYIGAEAVKVGLADRVGTFEGALADLSVKSPGPAPKRATPGGLSMEAPSPAVAATRSAADRAAIIEAGRKVGLDKLAGILADFPPASASLSDALEVIRFNGALKAESERHDSGLYLDPSLSVRGGPLFVKPDGAPGAHTPSSDHAWDDVIANMNAKIKKH